MTTHVKDEERKIKDYNSRHQENKALQLLVKNIIVAVMSDEERKIKHYSSHHQEDKALQQLVKNIIVALMSDEERKIKTYSSRSHQEDKALLQQLIKNVIVAVTSDEERKIKHYSSRHQEDKALQQLARNCIVEVLQQEVKNIIVAVTSDEERKIKHYSSRHRILLVGEGDFSFSACLAVAFGDAINIIATSLDTKAFLKKHYGKAMSNIAELRSRGGKVMHGIDATDIANHESLKHIKFHRIIFNFPYAGVFSNMSDEDQLRHHRRLVSKFLQNAKEMISEGGEIHVSHKTTRFHAEFKLESIASSHGLRLIQAVKFKKDHYPGYNTKCGFGGDGNYDCNPSKTFKFGLKTSDEERKIKHYSSRHRILLVGEGDFSFSACLAVAFDDATNIIATSLDTKAFLKTHYGKAMSNIAELRSRGGKVMHGIDATDIANHESLKHLKFHRIIFNFPYAGLFHKMSAECQLRHHRRLVSKFLQNAKEMLSERAEIHISHKTNGFHAEFKLESIASSHGLRLIEAVKFERGHYPSYNTKYGFGGDDNFDCNPSKTFKFGLKTAPV